MNGWSETSIEQTASAKPKQIDRERVSGGGKEREIQCACVRCVCEREREWVCYIYPKWRRDKDINTYINYKAYNSMRWASKKLQQINGNNKSTWFVYITFSVWRLLFVCVSSAVSPSCIYISCALFRIWVIGVLVFGIRFVRFFSYSTSDIGLIWWSIDTEQHQTHK